MRVIGYKKSNFKGNDGSTVNGYNVYLAYVIGDDGFGYKPLTKSFWLSDKKMVEFGVTSLLSDCTDVEPVMNIYGKLAGFKQISNNK